MAGAPVSGTTSQRLASRLLALVEVTAAGEVRLEYQGACRGCSLKSVTYVLGIRQKLMPIPGVTEVTVEGVGLSRAALERAARMYAGYSPWVGEPAN